MKPRVVVTSILLAFVAVSILFIVLKERRSDVLPGGAENRDTARVAETSVVGTDARNGGIAPQVGGGSREQGQAAGGNAGVEGNAVIRARRESGASGPALPDGISVYYFHATRRCARCRLFEEYTREALARGFPDELRDGTITWRVVNVDEPVNEHFVRDYSLTTKSVVLVEMNDGKASRWENLPRIWDLVGDKAAFIAYIQGELSDFRKGR